MSTKTWIRCVLLCSVLAPWPALGQIVLHPNQITGSISWTNTHPQLREALDRLPLGHHYQFSLTAVAVDTESRLTSTGGSNDLENREVTPYELSVETSPAGIRYRVLARVGDLTHDDYLFAWQLSEPVRPEPAEDVELDFAECAGGARIHLPPDVVNGEAAATIDDWPQATRSFRFPGAEEYLLLVRGGETYDVLVRYQTGEDPFSDTVSREKLFSDIEIPCDEIVDLDCTGGGGGSPALFGAIVGRFDVLGEQELPHDSGTRWHTLLEARSGPWANRRLDAILTDPASGPFELERLVPSIVTAPPTPYRVQADAMLDGTTWFRSAPIEVLVGNGELVDLGDELVIEPGLVNGEIALAGPPVEGELGSPLAWVELSNPEGEPGFIPYSQQLAGGSFIEATGTVTVPPGASRSTWGGIVRTDPRGAFAAATGDWNGDYDMPTPTLGREPGRFQLGRSKFQFRGLNDEAQPGSWLYGHALIADRQIGEHALEAGQARTLDRRYCFSQVTISFFTTAGTLFWPRVSPEGSFLGIDHEGRPQDYSADGTWYGTPTRTETAAASGQVIGALPVGEYSLEPQLRHLSESGAESLIRMAPIALAVGCRQRIEMRPELALSIGMDDLPACTEAGTLELTGRVVGDEPISSLTASVNGGAPQVVCTDCGRNPAFAADVALDDGGNELVVHVVDASGRTASVSAFSRHATEPSALDRRPGSVPVLARRSGTDLALSWEDIGPANLYTGSLTALWETSAYDHAGQGTCRVEGGSLNLDPGPGSRYVLVTAPCEWGDGSLGRDSAGQERPGALGRCP